MFAFHLKNTKRKGKKMNTMRKEAEAEAMKEKRERKKKL